MVDVITKIHMDILLLISDYVSTIKLISQRLKIPRSTIKRRIDELLEHNYITMVADGRQKIYLLTSKGNLLITKFSSTPEIARKDGLEVLKAHKVQWSAVILERPWELEESLKNHSFTVSKHKNWDKWTFYDHNEDLTIVFNPNKVHIFLHEFFIDNPMEYYPVSQERCIKVCTMLMEKFPGLKLGTPKRLFTIHSQHIVKQGGPLAKKFEEHAIKTGVPVVYHGKNLDIDHSQGEWEEETKNPRLAPAHMEDLGIFFDKWLEQPFFPSEIKDIKDSVYIIEKDQSITKQAIEGIELKYKDIEKSIIASETRVNELSNQISVSESVIKEAINNQSTVLRNDMELLGKGILDLGQGLNKLNEGHIILSKGQEILQTNIHDVNNSLNKLYESLEAQNANMETFAIAMAEHVVLVKALQENAENFNRGLDMLYRSHYEMLELIKELKKPWYVKLSESIKRFINKQKKIKFKY